MVQGQYIGVIKVFQKNGNMPARYTGPTCTIHRFFLVCKAEFFSVFIVSCLQFLFSGSQNSLLMMTKGRVRQLPYDTEKNSIREVLNGQDLKQLDQSRNTCPDSYQASCLTIQAEEEFHGNEKYL